MNRLLLVLFALVFSLTAEAAERTLKIATITPEGSDWMKSMRAGAEEIKERTEGRVNLKFYGGGIKGDDKKVVRLIRLGQLDGGAFTPAALSSQYVDLNLYGLPMTFDSLEEAAYVRTRMDARLMQGLEDAGWVNFGFAAGGLSVLMSNPKIETFEDLRGKKIWLPEGDRIGLEAMKALKLSPVPLPLTDVLTGLQTGLIDAVGMSPIGALVLQWHTKVTYITELPLIYTYGFLAIDKKAFNKIDEADQAIVREVMERIYRKFDEQNPDDNREAFQALVNKGGLEVVEIDVDDYKRTRAAVASTIADLGDKGLYTPELYDEMMQYIDEYRAEASTREAEEEAEVEAEGQASD
jgi:TRAP-type C4-dicarboxylate transport system substrate-binding protein